MEVRQKNINAYFYDCCHLLENTTIPTARILVAHTHAAAIIMDIGTGCLHRVVYRTQYQTSNPDIPQNQ